MIEMKGRKGFSPESVCRCGYDRNKGQGMIHSGLPQSNFGFMNLIILVDGPATTPHRRWEALVGGGRVADS